MDEIAVLRVPLENVGPHQIDERGGVGDLSQEPAARFHLDDFDSLFNEHATIIECLRADHTDLVPARREARRELVRQAFGAADLRIGALGEEDLHLVARSRKARARTRPRSRRGR